MRNRCLRLALSLVALVSATSAHAVPTIGLWITIDGSGSISSTNFALQRDAYVNVLGGVVPVDGSVAIGVSQFSATVEEVIGMTAIETQADLDSVVNAVAGMTQLGSLTAVGDAITDGANKLLAFEQSIGSDLELLIDVSTDGFSNFGADPIAAAVSAVGSGIDRINCLGVGGGANCGFIAGTDSFAINVNNFSDFEDALERKIEIETGGGGPGPGPGPAVPEPSAALVFGVGLLVVGGSCRRRR